MADWAISQLAPNVHVITFDDIRAGWSQRVLLSGDRHHDNRHAVWKLERDHLDEAVERNAPVVDLGDFFCLMQGKWDKRKDQSQLRPVHRSVDPDDAPYFDLVLDEAEDFYSPYADQFAVIGYGNHERSVIRHHEFDPLLGFARRMKHHATRPDTMNIGGYSGWVFFRFNTGKTQTMRLKYHHGYGGGGPVTKGVIQTNRRAVYLPDADFIVTAHIHEAWHVIQKRERISQRGKIAQDVQHHISVPTYKEEYADGFGGYHIESGRPPKPIGCVWLDFKYTGTGHGRVKASAELVVS